MYSSGDAAEQVVRMSLEGAEFALKITGSAAKNLAAALYTVLKDQKKTKGKARIETMLREKRPMTVYTIKKELHDVGIVTMNTPFGNPVPVYDMERTICDLIRSRSGIEMQTFQDALKQYAKRKDKDLRKLMRYAQMFRVEKLLRQYLEVLL